MLDALEIGYAIKKQRAKLALTQAQVANAAGISKRCLWSLELGQNPGVQLDKLIAVLGVLGLDLQVKHTKSSSSRDTQPTSSNYPAAASVQAQKEADVPYADSSAIDTQDILAILRDEPQ